MKGTWRASSPRSEDEATGRARGLKRRTGIALLLATLLLILTTAVALAVTGDLTQPGGTAGCISEDGSSDDGPGTCADGHALDQVDGVAVSPDGKNVYAASTGSGAGGTDAVVRFHRNTTTGAISQPAGTGGCVSQTGSGTCVNGRGLAGASAVAVSPDGKSIYVASYVSDAVARLNRNPTNGVITQPAGTAGCISQTGADGCADGHGLSIDGQGGNNIAVSPDGKSVYVTTISSVVRLDRNTTTGAITQPAGATGCISQTGAGPCVNGHALNGTQGVAVSPDGKSVYVGSSVSDAVARLNRNTTTGAITQPAGTAGCISETGVSDAGPGTCINGRGLDLVQGVAVSPDGKNVYTAANTAVARFNRNTTTGAIGQPAGAAGCVSAFGDPTCAPGNQISVQTGIAVSADGKNVYVAGQGVGNLRLDRNTTSGAISQPLDSTGCFTADGSGGCTEARAINGGIGVAVSPDGKNVYFTSRDDRAVARFNRAP